MYTYTHSCSQYAHTYVHTHTQGREHTNFKDDPDSWYHFDPHLLTSSSDHSHTTPHSGNGVVEKEEEREEEDFGILVEDCLSTITQFVPDSVVQSLMKR